MMVLKFYLLIVLIFQIGIDLSFECESLPDVVKHCKRISCEVRTDQKEYSTFQCDTGYEFRAGVTVDTFETIDGKIDEEIQCNAIGCKFKDIPNDENSIDPDSNVIVKGSVCIPAILTGHCLPEVSYVDFECKPGFLMDGETGFLTVKCLLSYLWDTPPMCDIPDNPTDPETTTTTTKSAIITTSRMSTSLAQNTTINGLTTPIVISQSPAISSTFSNSQDTRLTSSAGPTGPTGLTGLIASTNSPNGTFSQVTNLPVTATSASATNSASASGSVITMPSSATNLPSIAPSNFTTIPNQISTLSVLTTNNDNNNNNNNNTNYPVTTQRPYSSLLSSLIISSSTLQAYNVCFDVYPVPRYHNRSNVTMNLTTHDFIKNVYLTGSTIRFSCLYGYYPNRQIKELTITCLPSGKWSEVGNCEIHPCWSRLPRRPLNGRRDVGLIMTNSFYTNGSHVNFTCNQYYDLVGRNRLFCFGSEWEQNVPDCVLTPNTCTIKPNKTLGNAYLKQWFRVEIPHELDYNNTIRNLSIYTSADYTCFPGYKFKYPQYTLKKSYNNKLFDIQTIVCTGPEKWTSDPVCDPEIKTT